MTSSSERAGVEVVATEDASVMEDKDEAEEKQ